MWVTTRTQSVGSQPGAVVNTVLQDAVAAAGVGGTSCHALRDALHHRNDAATLAAEEASRLQHACTYTPQLDPVSVEIARHLQAVCVPTPVPSSPHVDAPPPTSRSPQPSIRSRTRAGQRHGPG